VERTQNKRRTINEFPRRIGNWGYHITEFEKKRERNEIEAVLITGWEIYSKVTRFIDHRIGNSKKAPYYLRG
jgi:hypothetical protein